MAQLEQRARTEITDPSRRASANEFRVNLEHDVFERMTQSRVVKTTCLDRLRDALLFHLTCVVTQRRQSLRRIGNAFVHAAIESWL